MKTCSFCGAENQEQVFSCRNCGNAFSGTEQVQPPQASHPDTVAQPPYPPYPGTGVHAPHPSQPVYGNEPPNMPPPEQYGQQWHAPPGAQPPPGYYQQGGYYQQPGYPPMGPPPGHYSQPYYGSFFAGFWIRFAAFFIDYLIIALVTSPVSIAISITSSSNSDEVSVAQVLLSIVFAAIQFTYFIFMTGKYGATLGKMALKLKVVRVDFTEVDYGTAAVRELSKILSGCVCYLGYIWVAFDDRKQSWHDKIANTYVIVTG